MGETYSKVLRGISCWQRCRTEHRHFKHDDLHRLQRDHPFVWTIYNSILRTSCPCNTFAIFVLSILLPWDFLLLAHGISLTTRRNWSGFFVHGIRTNAMDMHVKNLKIKHGLLLWLFEDYPLLQTTNKNDFLRALAVLCDRPASKHWNIYRPQYQFSFLARQPSKKSNDVELVG